MAYTQHNNVLLMTDGYKFSHHKQYPVSWLPPHAPRVIGTAAFQPPVIYEGDASRQGTNILALRPVPGMSDDPDRGAKITVVTNVSTAVVEVRNADDGTSVDIDFKGEPVVYTGSNKSSIVMELSPDVRGSLCLPAAIGNKVIFNNVDESKWKRGSTLNENFAGGYNVSYFTPRNYSDMFEDLQGDQIVFFGLQYFIKEYLAGEVITEQKINEAEHFVARYMADVRCSQENYANGFDHTMFPRGDWESMVSGDYDAEGKTFPERKGKLPIKIEALPEGSLLSPGVCCFKITNTHPRFFWLPNFLETLLVQTWYPISVATQAREFKKTIQAYSILSQRVSSLPSFLGPQEFTPENIAEDQLAIHIAQVFDLLDFGYRGVSSHETAGLGSAAYYMAGFEGSDTVAGSRLLLRHYNKDDSYTNTFENLHGATSVPAAEHSTITSWADVSPDADHKLYEAAEYCAFANMVKQYMPSFCVSLVSDGFNIWHAICCLWTSSDETPLKGGSSMRKMLSERLNTGKLTLVRPDSGEGFETLPQYMTVLKLVLPEHWQPQETLAPLRDLFTADDPRTAKYNRVVSKIRAKVGVDGNPFRRFAGQQFRVLQGDGVALNSVGDMLASLLANGFCANTVHFGSGGGLLQKLNRDSLGVAFKCCAMYVGEDRKMFPVGKDPIAGGKKSYGGNPPVIRGPDGVLRNRGIYCEKGNLVKAQPMSAEEFERGAEGDVLECVFKNGDILKEMNIKEVAQRAKITKLDDALTKALDNLDLKCDFLQRMTSDQAIAIRFAEASCGSKWAHSHETKLEEFQKQFPQYNSALERLGITSAMKSDEVVEHIKNKLVCDKRTKKAVMAALSDNEPMRASEALGNKYVVTM